MPIQSIKRQRISENTTEFLWCWSSTSGLGARSSLYEYPSETLLKKTKLSFGSSCRLKTASESGKGACVPFPSQSWEPSRLRPVLPVPAATGRGPRFDSQQPHGNLRPSVTPAPANPMSSFNLWRHKACIWCIDVHEGKTPTHMRKTHLNLGANLNFAIFALQAT